MPMQSNRDVFGGNMRETVDKTVRRPLRLLGAVAFTFLLPSASGQMQLNELATQAGIRIAAEGQSGSMLKDRATRQLPWSRISASERARIQAVLDTSAQYRRLPELHYVVEPSVYEYLVQHPDVAASTWRVLGISEVQIWQTGPLQYEAMAPDGSQGYADVVYRDNSQCLLLWDGAYNNPLIPRPITTRALLWLRYDFQPASNGQTRVRQKTDVFLAFPSATARAVALLISPVTNVMMDRNLFEISLYARMMSHAKVRDPAWMEQVALRMDGVLPQRRQELATFARLSRTPCRDRTMASDADSVVMRPSLKIFGVSIREFHTSPLPASATDGSAKAPEGTAPEVLHTPDSPAAAASEFASESARPDLAADAAEP